MSVITRNERFHFEVVRADELDLEDRIIDSSSRAVYLVVGLSRPDDSTVVVTLAGDSISAQDTLKVALSISNALWRVVPAIFSPSSKHYIDIEVATP